MKTYRHSGAGMIECKGGQWVKAADANQAFAEAAKCDKPCKKAPAKKATK